MSEILMKQGLIAVGNEAKKEIKDDLQLSLKEKEKTGSEEGRHKGKRGLLKKEWVPLSQPQGKFFFSLKLLKQMLYRDLEFHYKAEKTSGLKSLLRSDF